MNTRGLTFLIGFGKLQDEGIESPYSIRQVLAATGNSGDDKNWVGTALALSGERKLIAKRAGKRWVIWPIDYYDVEDIDDKFAEMNRADKLLQELISNE